MYGNHIDVSDQLMMLLLEEGAEKLAKEIIETDADLYKCWLYRLGKSYVLVSSDHINRYDYGDGGVTFRVLELPATSQEEAEEHFREAVEEHREEQQR